MINLSPSVMGLGIASFAFLALIILFFQFQIILTNYKTKFVLFQRLVKAYLLMFLGIASVPFGVLIGGLQISGILKLNFRIHSLSFFLYLGLYLYGNAYFFNNVIKIPAERKYFVSIFNRFMYIVYLFSFVIFLRSLGFLSTLFLYRSNEETFSILLISLISFFLFYFFFTSLEKEKIENQSKLTQARLQLTKYLVIFQFITVILIIGLGITLLSLEGDANKKNLSRLLFSFLFSLNSVFGGQIIIISLKIPKFVRKRYKLGSERYNTVKQLQDI